MPEAHAQIIAHQSNHPITTHLTNTPIQPSNNPGLREFNPRQRPTHHQQMQSNHPIKLPPISPILPFNPPTTKHTTKDKPGLREFNPRQRPTHHQHTNQPPNLPPY